MTDTKTLTRADVQEAGRLLLDVDEHLGAPDQLTLASLVLTALLVETADDPAPLTLDMTAEAIRDTYDVYEYLTTLKTAYPGGPDMLVPTLNILYSLYLSLGGEEPNEFWGEN